MTALLAAGASPDGAVRDVGDGIRAATVREPGGAVLGIIENLHFRLDTTAPVSTGSGR